MASPGRGPAFVLIHSPLVGPTTWSPLAEELERRGREAVVPPLLGVADAPSPQWRYVPEAVRAAAARAGGPAVLVGHSGGGFLLPVIAHARPGECDAHVFIDSFLPPASGSVPAHFGSSPIGLELVLRCRRDGNRSDATNYLGGLGDVLESKAHRGQLEHLGELAQVALYENDRQIEQLHYRWEDGPEPSYTVRFWELEA